ncbi:MAG: hypothetical protein JRI23_11095 [Deltaproteobacteria bacterium]|nr:hypothetical protein [Deltaproteobacteria bacterium]MBW2532228.1 hypothetical protein [Deltaproteobacteria bacterium]
MGRDSTGRERVLAGVLSVLTKRYDAMMEAMKRVEMEVPIIEDLVLFGVDRGRAEGEAKGEAKGRVAAKAEAVLTVLRARGLEVPADVERRISTCGDPEQLEQWLRLAARAHSASEILG